MIRIRGPDAAGRIGDPVVRRLVEERFEQVLNGDEYDPEIHISKTQFVLKRMGPPLTKEKSCGITILFDDELRMPSRAAPGGASGGRTATGAKLRP